MPDRIPEAALAEIDGKLTALEMVDSQPGWLSLTRQLLDGYRAVCAEADTSWTRIDADDEATWPPMLTVFIGCIDGADKSFPYRVDEAGSFECFMSGTWVESLPPDLWQPLPAPPSAATEGGAG